MQPYIGTKYIQAEPQERDGAPGYKVQYPPDGYESWSPKDKFEEAYQPLYALDFMHAYYALATGLADSVSRQAWAMLGIKVKLQVPDENSKMTEPYLYMEHNSGAKFPWTVTAIDLEASDWTAFDAKGEALGHGASEAFQNHRENNPVTGESVGPEADQPTTESTSESTTENQAETAQPSDSPATDADTGTSSSPTTPASETPETTSAEPSDATAETSSSTETTGTESSPAENAGAEANPTDSPVTGTDVPVESSEHTVGNGQSESTADTAGEAVGTEGTTPADPAKAQDDTTSTTPTNEVTIEQLKSIARDIINDDHALKDKIVAAVNKYGEKFEDVVEADYGNLYNDLVAIKEEKAAPVMDFAAADDGDQN